MKPLCLFVRPPRPLWPFNGPSTAFWPPLAFASLAAALREGLQDIDVRILDAPALRMGWRSLERALRSLRPAWVGMGEEAVSAREGLRLAALAKAAGAKVIAGGCFFGNVAREVIATGLVDVVVHGEGESTIVELVEALRGGSCRDLRLVRGISFLEGTASGDGDPGGPHLQVTGVDGEIRTTPPRELIPDLDRLPLPAYDLLPVDRYGATSRSHPALAAVELGRGCTGSCSFCVLWRQMGRFAGNEVRPSLRTKSAERILAEVRRLTAQFDRRYLGWVDPCFNAHPRAAGDAAETLLRSGIRIGQSAWVRADGIVRDARSGALERCVRSGLNEVYIGIERADDESLRSLGKGADVDCAREALAILSCDFPDVLRVGSFIYGLPEDTPSTMRALHRQAVDLDLDMAFFIPLTPLPGTPYWKPGDWDPTGERYRRFDFLPTYGPDGEQARLGRALLASIALDWRPRRVGWYLRRLATSDPRRRRIHRRLFWRGLRFSTRRAVDALLRRDQNGAMRFPSWYEE